MIFRALAIDGPLEVLPERARDDRGAFFRGFCTAEFAAAGLDFRPVQVSYSENPRRHTLRGMHWQDAPAAEAKLIRCVRGAAHDVAIDIRRGSPGFRRHAAVTLSAEAGNAIFIPAGFAHGFLSLSEDAVLEYMMDTPYEPTLARGLRWNDPAFAVPWPAEPAVISARDASWPDFDG
ncbi:dTDP-4-dehydrorhamnose 3,5-epimerase family protein [Falsiroseomonas oryzae]|uniref:dTDP-4-dehydrorhamnose 3,5-epimerase family protein n=1 Tax=Falsiroseomonas oryzae TaxID=2766473 RepID=UPI0022EAB1EB|nr:dTDP-4-dehydrorhamnose 3,5-epimerase family protein [Roseomonas sp. MO-31]